MPDVPDVEADPRRHSVLRWALEPGDAVAFHMLTLHAAAGVPPGGPRRRAYSVRCIGPDMVYAPRPWTTSPDLAEHCGGESPGRPFRGGMFPRLPCGRGADQGGGAAA